LSGIRDFENDRFEKREFFDDKKGTADWGAERYVKREKISDVCHTMSSNALKL
jgi:hypothetical protein